jgi:hypothetical protein
MYRLVHLTFSPYLLSYGYVRHTIACPYLHATIIYDI